MIRPVIMCKQVTNCEAYIYTPWPSNRTKSSTYYYLDIGNERKIPSILGDKGGFYLKIRLNNTLCITLAL